VDNVGFEGQTIPTDRHRDGDSGGEAGGGHKQGRGLHVEFCEFDALMFAMVG
jgi:hypothetical protein